ncbi:polyubiquitin binding protein [Blumeria hordei DH14]|uniref:Polyubiquitin binding protein n=1 Tax=Blumeria graminis f. sp. hordei (strain DH14) TaxID=546991 RepID=N1JF05_BLUG1|nr:polyubiquitin binding protein [Blumeria hordei DH14]
MTEYKLSATLSGHENDVRAVLHPTSELVISASRDNTTRLWRKQSDNKVSFDPSIASKSGHWLNALTYLPPNNEYPEGLVFAAGKDLIIEVRQPSKASDENAEALLLGHSNTICALDIDPSGTFVVSGAWDHEVRIWPVGKWECESILEYHEGSVWAVLAFSPEIIITGCADQKVRIFHKAGNLLKSFQASKSPVRALCRLPKDHVSGGDFASADNDGVIRFWTLAGKQMDEARGHESFIYSLASLPSGEIISSGEDRTLRIWRGNECIQTITHPAVSVWSVAACPENGDIVSGASDKIVRVFTRSTERMADEETTKDFESAIKSTAIPQQTMPSINKEKLPGPDFLKTKLGTKDGQVQMILEENGSISAHTWSKSTGKWTNVGVVVDAVGSNGNKKFYNGQEFDFVFDVDMEDGKPPLKLPYNLSENPYDAATRFIKDNEAPSTYLEEIASFIIKNTQGSTIGQNQQQASADPWGSDERYRPGDGTSTADNAQNIKPSILPQKSYLSILATHRLTIHNKVKQINTALLADNQNEIALHQGEEGFLSDLCANLKDPTAANVSVPEIEVAVKIATRWPYKDRLPGLDLIRLVAVASEAATYRNPGDVNLVDLVINGSSNNTPVIETHIMMAIRALVNLFISAEGRKLVMTEFKKIHNFISSSTKATTNRNLLVAATTVYLNYSVIFTEGVEEHDPEISDAIVEVLGEILSNQNDSEIVYRALVALGSFVATFKDIRSKYSNPNGIAPIVQKSLSQASDPRIRNVGQELLNMLV